MTDPPPPGAPRVDARRPTKSLRPSPLLRVVPSTRGATVPRQLVPRGALLERFGGLDPAVSLVLLTAPVGYGKTTTAREFASHSGRSCVWLEAGPEHRDPQRLVQDLALALLRLGPLDDVVADVVVAPDDMPLAAAVDRLAAGVAAVDREVVLVLDQVHRLRTSGARKLVVALADRLPAGSRLVVTADRPPGLRLTRLRAQGRCLELGPQDLAFTRAETSAVLAAAGLGLPGDAVDEVVRRTEGWPTGVHLAKFALQEASDPLTAVGDVGGWNRGVAAYFGEEVLARAPADVGRFLLRTSVLDRMSAPLCDAVLGATGSASLLARIESLGLFVLPEDDRGEWYRYHRMFREMLRTELRRREPGEDEAIARRASAWFAEHGAPEVAMEYALAGHDDLRAAELIVANAQDLASRGLILRVRGWLESLDEGVLERYPPLAAMATWIWGLTGELARAHQALRIAESARFDGPLPDGSASLTSAVLRARAALAPDGVEAMLTDAREALLLEPPGSRWHTLAALLLGTAQILTGEPAEASDTFERAVRYGRDQQRPGASFALAQQALVAADVGDWSTAEARATRSRQEMEAGNLFRFLPNLLTYIASARVALHRGNTDRALRHVRHALHLGRTPSLRAFPQVAAQADVVLGRLLLDLDDPDGAARLVADARAHLAVLPTAGLLPLWVEGLDDDVRRRQRQRLGQVDAATSLTAAEMRVLRELPTYRSLAQIADDLVVSRNTVKSQAAAVYRKLGAVNRAEAVQRAEELGLISRGAGPLGHPSSGTASAST